MMSLGSTQSQFGCSILHNHGQIKHREPKKCQDWGEWGGRLVTAHQSSV